MPEPYSDGLIFPGSAEREWSAAELYVADLVARNFTDKEVSAKLNEMGFAPMSEFTVARRRKDPEFADLVALRVRDIVSRAIRQKQEDGEVLRGQGMRDIAIRVKRARKLTEQRIKEGIDPEDAQEPIFAKITDAIDATAVGHKFQAEALGLQRGPGVQVNLQNNTQVNVGQAAAALSVRDVDAFLYEDLGLARGSVYRRVVWLLRQAERSDVRRVILCCGKGSGKGYLTSLFLARQIQRLLACRDFRAAYGPDVGDRPRLGVLNLSAAGGEQAEMAVFTDLLRWLAGPWFKQVSDPTRQTSDLVEWARPDGSLVCARCGNSRSEGVEGINWVSAGADEVCRLPEKDNTRILSADALVGPVEDTMVSRFGATYKLLLASWPEHQGDYLLGDEPKEHPNGQIAKARRTGIREDLTAAFLGEPLTWEGGEVEEKRREGIAQAPFAEYRTEVFLSNDGTLVVHCPMWQLRPNVDLEALRTTHARDEVTFAARFGARPRAAGENALFPDPQVIRTWANPNRKAPWDEAGHLLPDWQPDTSALYFAHLDGAARKDCAGLAVAHWADGKVIVDGLLERHAPKGGEMDLDSLREPVHEMQRRGATFAKATTDGWMGIALQQDFRKAGIRSEHFSVDKDRRAYDTTVDALKAGAVDYYDAPGLYENAASLVIISPRKIDHSRTGRKDLFDAMAAVCFAVIEKMGKFAGLAVAPAEPPDEKREDPEQRGR